MKLNLKKSNLKRLSKNDSNLPSHMTPFVGGAKFAGTHYDFCEPDFTKFCPPIEKLK